MRPLSRRILLPALLLLLVPLLALPARAAQVSRAERFYADNLSRCTLCGHAYRLNGPSGYVTVYDSPVSGAATDYLLNEHTLTAAALYPAGAQPRWALVRYEPRGRGTFTDGGGESGWVSLAELARCYDKEQFVSEHLDEFVIEPVTLDMNAYDDVLLWAYPGCGGQAEQAGWYVRTEADKLLEFPAYWLDSLGRRWGAYSFFGADGFICLDEPGLSENLLPEIAESACIIPAADGGTLPRLSGAAAAGTAWLWPGVGAAAVLAATGGALLLRRRRVTAQKRRRRQRRH